MGKTCKKAAPRAKLEKRVAAYARVSLETDRLAHSLSAQTGYYSEFILKKPDWVLAGIYADSFISGTGTSNRADFKRLIQDCERGKIDIVLCKSVSRFARNTVDLLNTVRRLKELGIEVCFEKESISSLSEEGELLMTIIASFAQEESRSISENVKWGIRKRFRNGTAVARNKLVLGYRYDGEKYVIVPEEAETVRQIFREYINGVPLRRIAENMKGLGRRGTKGGFSHTHINYIVRNELYIGNIVLQKTFVRDFITHTKAPNCGVLPQYRFFDCHEPIIDEKTFAQAQREALRRAAARSRSYRYTGRLVCGRCGGTFTRRSNNGKYPCWHCRDCLDVKLKENRLDALFDMTDSEFFEDVRSVTVNSSENAPELVELDIKYCDGRTEKWQYE